MRVMDPFKRLPIRHVLLRGVTAKQLIVVLVRQNIRDTIFAVMMGVQIKLSIEEFA